MESQIIATDITIRVELFTKNECISLINEITSLITNTDNEIILEDTSVFDDNKLIFTKREIPIVLIFHGNFKKNEFSNGQISKYYVSVEFTDLENCNIAYPLLQELIQLLKGYQIPYELSKVTFALDITLQGSFHSINIEKNSNSYLLDKAVIFIKDSHRHIIRKQITNNNLRILTTLENNLFYLDHLIIDKALHNVKFHIDNTKVVTLDFNFILDYLNNIFNNRKIFF